MPASAYFKPIAGRFGLQMVTVSTRLGTGGTTIADTATTSVVLPVPYRKCQLVEVAFNGLVAAVSASGTVKAQVIRRNNTGTPADVNMTASTSIEADVIATADKTYNVAITGTTTQTIFQPGDSARVDVVTTNSVGTQPTVNVTATFAILN